MQVIVDGLMTHYERNGSGKTVLLLHGWGDTHETFRAISDMLKGGFEVLALDLPGFGKTAPPKSTWGLSEYADFVAHFLAKIDIKHIYAIIGHSNGGAISIRALSSGVVKTDKLVLLSSAGIRGEYKGRIKAVRLVTKTGKLLTKPLPKSVKKRLRHTVYQSVGSDMLVAEHLQDTFKKVISEDVQAEAPKVKAETLLIYGDNDTATPARYGERFAALMPHAHLEVLTDAGHFVHHDKPDTVDRLLVEFLR